MDTFLRLVSQISGTDPWDRLSHGIEFMAIHDTLTLKLQENEAKFWETTIKILENFLGQTSLKSTLSLINGKCVYSYAACKDVN